MVTTTTTSPLPARHADGTPTEGLPIELIVQEHDQLDTLTTWTHGRAPTADLTTATTAEGDFPQIEVGISAQAATELGITVDDAFLVDVMVADDSPGNTFGFRPEHRVIRVTGICEALDPAAAAWDVPQEPFTVGQRLSFDGTPVANWPLVLAQPGALEHLAAHWFPVTMWRFPVDVGAVPVSDLPALGDALRTVSSVRVEIVGGSAWDAARPVPLTIHDGVTPLLTGHRVAVTAARSIVAVMSWGVGAVAAATVVMAAAQLQARHTRATALARARGMSLRQVLAGTVPPAMVTVTLAAALGLVAGTALAPAGRWGPPLIVAAATAVGALIAVVLTTAFGYRAQGVARRARGRARWRVLAELGAVALAVLGIVLLRQRGLAPAAQGIDPLLALALVPVLLAVVAALLALRIGPLPTGAAARAAQSGRGAPLFIGLTAARQAPGGTGPERGAGSASSASTAVVVVAVAFAVFASSLASTVAVGQQQSSWGHAGADLVVTASAGGPVLDVDGFGTRAVVPAVLARRGSFALAGGGSETPVTVLALDLAEYRAARHAQGVAAQDGLSDLDALLGGPSEPMSDGGSRGGAVTVGQVQVLTAQGAGLPAGAPANLTIAGAVLSVQVTAESSAVPSLLPSEPGRTARSEEPIVLVDLAAIEAAQPNTTLTPNTALAFTDSDQTTRALAASLAAEVEDGGVAVVSRPDLLEELEGAPLVRAARTLVTLAIVAGAGYAMLAIGLGLLAGAPLRARSLSVLRTLGMRPRAALGLLAAELTPSLLITLLAGAGVGLALLPLTGPALNLRTYTGGLHTPAIVVARGAVLAVVGVAALAVALAVLVTVLIDRRRHLGADLRVGGTP